MRFILFLILALPLLAGCAIPQPEASLPAPTNNMENTAGMAEQAAVEQAAAEQAVTVRPAPTVTSLPTPTLPATASPVEPLSGEEGQSPVWVAYTGQDGNLWMVDRIKGEKRQITQDANPWQSGGQSQPDPVITYCCSQWSSDGKLLAYRRETGTSNAEGYQSQYALWVYDLANGAARPILENQNFTGFAWKPLTHLIAYSLPIATEFFATQSSEYAQGIWAIEVDTGRTIELVKPVRGLPLVNPQWSPDGRFLSFEEVIAMEGRGNFAYYDFEAQDFVSWDEAIGGYSWSPDGRHVAYDRLTYAPSGSERIWLKDRQGGQEELFSPDYTKGYAFNPLYPLQGDRLAYIAELNGPESNQYTLFVQPISGDVPLALGTFENIQSLAWAADGKQLVFSAGPYEQQQIIEVSAVDGMARVLAAGNQPALQPTEWSLGLLTP